MELDERAVKEMVVASVGSCAACGRPFDAESVTVLGHEDNLWFLMIVCRGCSSHGLVAALLKESALQAKSDLTDDEVDRFRHTDCVTADDVLEMHEFLKDFNGDFVGLFGLPRDRRP